MDCNQAFELDLAEFLATPRAAPFDAFRAHYPRCEVCSAEVRAWTELHAQLGSDSHPAADALAGYAGLPEAERARIDAHTADCAACREELRLLEAFDPASFAQPAAAAAPERAARAGGWFEALSRLVWHPAFAYGLAILVVAPVLWRTQRPGRFGERAAAPPVAVVAERGQLQEAEAPVDATEAGSAAPTIEPSEKAVAPPATLAAAPAPRARAGTAGAPEAKLESDAVAPAVPTTVAVAPPAPARELTARKSAQAQASDERAASLRDAAATREVNHAFAAEPAARPSAESAGPAPEALARGAADSDGVALPRPTRGHVNAYASTGAELAQEAAAAPPRLAPVVWDPAPGPLRIAIPVARGAARAIEVVVSDVRAGRRATHTAEAQAGSGEASFDIARQWLTPGEYQLSVRDGELEPQAWLLPILER